MIDKEQRLIAEWLESDEGAAWALGHFTATQYGNRGFFDFKYDNETHGDRSGQCDCEWMPTICHGWRHVPGAVDVEWDDDEFVYRKVAGPKERWTVQ